MKISCVVAIVILVVARLAAADVRATPVVREGRVWVALGLPEGLTPELRQAVLSGLPVTFTYDIELRRGVPFSPDRTLSSMTIAVTVTYDSLTRLHSLARTFDGRIEATKVSKDEEEVRRWLTALESVPMFRPRISKRYRVPACASVPEPGRTDSAILWPWDRGLVTNTNFAFIP